MPFTRSRYLAALMLLFALFWIGAPLIHLLHEHGEHDEDEGDHRFCSLFHNLSQQTAVEAPEPVLVAGSFERIALSKVEPARNYAEEAHDIRGPPNSV